MTAAILWPSVIGLLGVLVGVSINELIRRSNRIEIYSARVFDKRLETYAHLIKLMHSANDVAAEVMENAELSDEDRHEMISVPILEIAEFAEQNALYLDSELASHCVATFMGAEDVLDIRDEAGRARARQDIVKMYADARRMIREDSGVAAIDRLFKRVARPRLSSPIIERIRELRRQNQ